MLDVEILKIDKSDTFVYFFLLSFPVLKSTAMENTDMI